MPNDTLGAESYASGPLAVLGALLALVGLGLVPVAVALARHVFPQRVVFFARWGFSHVLTAFAVLLVSGSLSILLVPGTGFLAGFHRQIIVHLVLAVLMWIVARRRHPSAVEALGLERRLSGRAVVAGLGVLLLLLPGLFGVGLAWPWLCEALGIAYAPQDVLVGFLELEGAELAWACALAILVVPFFEELLFRGFLQPLLCQNLGEQGGVIVTSLLFGSLHETAFLPIFVLSWILGAVMLRTHRLVAPWAMHALFNAVNLALLLWVPASRDVML